MEKLKLVKPTIEYKSQAKEYIDVLQMKANILH